MAPVIHPEEEDWWNEDAKTQQIRKRLEDLMRDQVYAVCKEREKDEIARAKWLPKFVTADLGFFIVHMFFLIVFVVAIAYSMLSAFYQKENPAWGPMALAAMTYPMVPVVLICWVGRRFYGHRRRGGQKDTYVAGNGKVRWWRMTPGYYFANMKMALLPSLGPGFLINFLADKFIVRSQEYVGAPAYRDFAKSFSWIAGCCIWFCIASLLKDRVIPREGRRKDYGLYERLYVAPSMTKNWKTWIHKGPHIAFFVIPCPEHGTVLKVFEANMWRAGGITVCCLVVWGILFELWTKVFSAEFKESWELSSERNKWVGILIETEFMSLVVNTITAPFLIGYTWRPEPRESLLMVKNRPSVRELVKGDGDAVTDKTSATSASSVAGKFDRSMTVLETPSGNPEQILLDDPEDEKEVVLQKVVTAIMNFPLHALAGCNNDVYEGLMAAAGSVTPGTGTAKDGPSPQREGSNFVLSSFASVHSTIEGWGLST